MAASNACLIRLKGSRRFFKGRIWNLDHPELCADQTLDQNPDPKTLEFIFLSWHQKTASSAFRIQIRLDLQYVNRLKKFLAIIALLCSFCQLDPELPDRRN